MIRYSALLILALVLSHCAKPQPRPAGAKDRTAGEDGKADPGPESPAPQVIDTRPKPGGGTDTEGSGTGPKDPGTEVRDPGTGSEVKDPETPPSEDPKENGGGGIAPPTQEFGGLNEPLSTSGFISGWAGIQGQPDEYLTVKLYLDGDNTKGKPIGSLRANLVAFDNGLEGDHGFIYDLPADALDGKIHKLHLYVVWNGLEYPISKTKPTYDVRGFTPKGQAVATAFAKTGFMVNGRVNPSCRSCHGAFSYEDRFKKMTEPSPDTGEWSAEKNYLINKLRRGHLDPQRVAPCSVLKCDEVVNWWKQEFGS